MIHALARTLALALGLAACSTPAHPPPSNTSTTAAPTATPATAPTTRPAVPPAPAGPVADSPSRVVTERFHSQALGVDKDVVVYLPRGYDAQPARRYPVFYYLHGLGGDEGNWVKGGKLDATADQLGLEAIVVMPDGDDDFYIDSSMPIDLEQCLKTGAGLFMPARQDPAKTCVRTRSYETYLSKDLVGWVDATYRTLATREARAIAGLSMGGFGAMQLALRHQELFNAAASHSGAVALLYKGPRPFAPGKTILATQIPASGKEMGPLGPWLVAVFGTELEGWRRYDVVALAEHLAPGKLALYFDCGTEDDFHLNDNLQYVHEALTARHLDHEFFLGPGRHDFTFWSARLPSSLTFLRDHTAKAR